MSRALALVALSLLGCGGDVFTANYFPDAGGDVAADALEDLGDETREASGDESSNDAAQDLDVQPARDSGADVAADVVQLGDAAAEADAGDGFDGCVTTPLDWCSNGGTSAPCGPGNWSCEAGLCVSGACVVGVACWTPGGLSGHVAGCAP